MQRIPFIAGAGHLDTGDPKSIRAAVQDRQKAADRKLKRYERLRDRLLAGRTEAEFLNDAERVGPYLTWRGASRSSRTPSAGASSSSTPFPGGQTAARLMPTAAAYAAQQVAPVRKHPAARLALLRSLHEAPPGRPELHLRYRRAALALSRGSVASR